MTKVVFSKRYLSGMMAGVTLLAAGGAASAQGLPSDGHRAFIEGAGYGMNFAIQGVKPQVRDAMMSAAAGKGPAYVQGLRDGITCVIDRTKASMAAQGLAFSETPVPGTRASVAQAAAGGDARGACISDENKRFTDSFKPR